MKVFEVENKQGQIGYICYIETEAEKVVYDLATDPDLEKSKLAEHNRKMFGLMLRYSTGGICASDDDIMFYFVPTENPDELLKDNLFFMDGEKWTVKGEV